MYGLDYAVPMTDPAWFTAIKSKGYYFVVRYLSDHTGGKVITASELTAVHGSGLGLGLVWETTAERPIGTGTYAEGTFSYWSSPASAEQAGQTDGAAAAAQAFSVGYPSDKPIYFAADFDIDYDAPVLRRTLVAAYFKGIAESVPLKRIGVYGGWYTLDLCNVKGLTTWYWQTSSWSTYGKLSYTHFFQDHNSTASLSYAGAPGVDFNATVQTNTDQFLWMPNSPVPVVPTPDPIVSEEVSSATVVFSNVTTNSFQWRVTGLHYPFTKANYQKAMITAQILSNPNVLSGWYSVIQCRESSTTYTSTETPLSGICSNLSRQSGVLSYTLHAWVQVANGTWYPLADCLVTFLPTPTVDETVTAVTTNTTLYEGISENSKTITGLTNGKDYYFQLKVTRTNKDGTVTVLSNTIKLTPQLQTTVFTPARTVARGMVISQ